MITIQTVSSKITDGSGNALTGVITITPNATWEYNDGTTTSLVAPLPIQVSVSAGILVDSSGNPTGIPLVPTAGTAGTTVSVSNAAYLATYSFPDIPIWTETWSLPDGTTPVEITDITLLASTSLASIPTQGPQGTNGLSVLNGTSDPSSIDGVDGDFYINTSTLTIFGPKGATLVGQWDTPGTALTGPAGAAGAAGATGATGATGPAGTSILYGTSDPTGAVGNDGDFYINTTTNYLFGPKASGVWPAGTSLIGAGVPAGGTIGQRLVKNSATDYDTIWQSSDYVGSFATLAALQTAYPTGSDGQYAIVQANPVVVYAWDTNTTAWVSVSGAGSYTLPAATSSTLGGVIVGTGLDVTSGGVLSASGGGGGGGGTYPSPAPAALLYLAAMYSYAGSNATASPDLTASFDTTSSWSNTSHTYTPNVAGYYWASYQISLAAQVASGVPWFVTLQKNNGTQQVFSPGTMASVYASVNPQVNLAAAGLFYLNGTTDYLHGSFGGGSATLFYPGLSYGIQFSISFLHS